MANWSPPKFYYFKEPSGNLLAVDEQGQPLTSQPTLGTKETDAGTGSVVDPWGNIVEEYEIPPYTVHVATDRSDGSPEWVGVAVDADGVPVPLVPNLTIESVVPQTGEVAVLLPDGSKAVLPAYRGPEEYYVHVAWSGTPPEAGTPEYELVAVDASGVPLPVQPALGGEVDPTDPSTNWAHWGAGKSAHPPPYEFPRFSVHLEYSDAAYQGTAAVAPVPVAIGADGKPLAIQPDFEVDPTEPSRVVAVLPTGDKIESPAYEFPPFKVYLDYPAASYSGSAAPIPTPIAVDDGGNPLPVQPHLEVDPSDPTQVKATFPDWSTSSVEVYRMPKDFFVHVEASGPPSSLGSQQFAAVAGDADGDPLPLQPYLEIDPMDSTKVRALFPDGTSYQVPSLYPPPGVAPTEWPPPQDTPETPEVAGEDENAAVEVVEETDPDDAGVAAADVPETTTGADTTFEPEQNYAGVELLEGGVTMDDDRNIGTPEEDQSAEIAEELLTAGLEAATTPGAPASMDPDPVDLAGGGEVSGLPIPLPGPDEVSGLPIPLPGPDEVSGLPIPLPGPDEVSGLPIPLPGPDEVLTNSLPMPEPAGTEEIPEFKLKVPAEGEDDLSYHKLSPEVEETVQIEIEEIGAEPMTLDQDLLGEDVSLASESDLEDGRTDLEG